MKKHVYPIDQEKGNYLLPETFTESVLFGSPASDLIQVEYYAQGWYRTRYFKKSDLDIVNQIFVQISQVLKVNDVKEFLKEKYFLLVQKWSIDCYVDGKLCLNLYEINQRLLYKAFPWVINFELTKLFDSIEAEQQHKNLAMSILRCEVAYKIRAVPGD